MQWYKYVALATYPMTMDSQPHLYLWPIFKSPGLGELAHCSKTNIFGRALKGNKEEMMLFTLFKHNFTS